MNITNETKLEPCVIKSSFEFKNGKRITIYTSTSGIVSYECDKDWKIRKAPFATMPLERMTESNLEYHLKIRNTHSKEDFKEEHSTNLNDFIN